MANKEKVIEFSNIDKVSACWNWNAHTDKDGYGDVWHKGKMMRAHRVSYELFVGKIPDGLFVLHKCDNPGCVNPDHLFTGTHTENIRDMILKGRDNFPDLKPMIGEDHPLSKLSEKDVLEIRSKYVPWKYSCRMLAKEYGVSSTVIHLAIKKKLWSHVK